MRGGFIVACLLGLGVALWICARSCSSSPAPASASASAPESAPLSDEERVRAAFPPGSKLGPPADPHGLVVDADGVHLPLLPKRRAFELLTEAWGESRSEHFQQGVQHVTRWASSDGTCALMEEDPDPDADPERRWATVRFVPCASLAPDER